MLLDFILRDGDIVDSKLGENIKIPYLNGGLSIVQRKKMTSFHSMPWVWLMK